MQIQLFVLSRSLSRTFAFLLIALLPYALSSECLVHAQESNFHEKLEISKTDQDDFDSDNSQLTFMGGVVLSREQVDKSVKKKYFGGFSAIAVSQGGLYLTAISDAGNVLEGRLKYNSENNLIAVTNTVWKRLSGLGKRHLHQAEAIATLNDGSFIISIEDKGKLLRYRPFCKELEVISLPNDFYDSQNSNDNVEALTALSDGRLLMFSQGNPSTTRIYNAVDNSWLPVGFALNGEFRPAGATTLPNGDVIVLENHWFKKGDKRMEIRLMRIRNRKLMSIQKDELLVGEEIAHFGETKSKTIDRFEGIASCRNRDGQTFLYLISDDNWPTLQNKNQRTILLMFMLTDEQ